MSEALSQITLPEWDARWAALATARPWPWYVGPLGRHVEAGDLRLSILKYDNSPAALRLWNFLLTEEQRLGEHRAAGRKLVGAMKDLGTVPVMACSVPELVAFYPDGAWWVPCIMALSSGDLEIADRLGIDESFCPVRAMLGAFLKEAHFPRPDVLISSAGATCDDFSAITQRLAALGFPILWWEVPHRRRGEGVPPLRGAGILPASSAGVPPASSSFRADETSAELAGRMPAPRSGVLSALCPSTNSAERQAAAPEQGVAWRPSFAAMSSSSTEHGGKQRPPCHLDEPCVELPGGFVAPRSQVDLVRMELDRVRHALEGLAGRAIDDAALADGIVQANHFRARMRELRTRAYTAPRCPMGALEMLIAEMLAIHFCSDRAEATAVIDELLGEVRRRVAAGAGVLDPSAVPIFWVNPVADLRAMNLLESCGGRLCGTDFMFAHALDEIPQDVPPMEALSRMALADPMVGPASDRAERICRDVAAFGAAGVVVSRIPGASHCAAESDRIAEVVRRRLNLPVVQIEVPPVLDAVEPSIRTRLEALVETARGG